MAAIATTTTPAGSNSRATQQHIQKVTKTLSTTIRHQEELLARVVRALNSHTHHQQQQHHHRHRRRGDNDRDRHHYYYKGRSVGLNNVRVEARPRRHYVAGHIFPPLMHLGPQENHRYQQYDIKFSRQYGSATVQFDIVPSPLSEKSVFDRELESRESSDDEVLIRHIGEALKEELSPWQVAPLLTPTTQKQVTTAKTTTATTMSIDEAVRQVQLWWYETHDDDDDDDEVDDDDDDDESSNSIYE